LNLQPAGAAADNILHCDAAWLQTDKLWLYEKFAPFGAVLSVKVLTNEVGLCKGVGFINYRDQDAAQQAVSAMNGMPMGSDKRLHVALQTHRSR
jgi:polyadenylate-binding protein